MLVAVTIGDWPAGGWDSESEPASRDSIGEVQAGQPAEGLVDAQRSVVSCRQLYYTMKEQRPRHVNLVRGSYQERIK